MGNYRGNNAVSYNGLIGSTTAQSYPVLNFNYTQDPTQEPTVQVNLDAARTNAFATVNMMHDISYLYGFTEVTFNFQNDNFGKGGKGNDRAQISVQVATSPNQGEPNKTLMTTYTLTALQPLSLPLPSKTVSIIN